MLRHDEFRYEPTGTCFTLKDKMRKLEEHSPCRNGIILEILGTYLFYHKLKVHIVNFKLCGVIIDKDTAKQDFLALFPK